MTTNHKNNLLEPLHQAATHRLTSYFNKTEKADFTITKEWEQQKTETEKLLKQKLTTAEHLLFLIALAPHIQPHFFDDIIQSSIPEAGDFPQFGGVRGKNFRGFLPTGETALFILAGGDMEQRLEVQRLFAADHFFAKNRILWLEEPPAGEPRMSGKIIIGEDYVDLFITGKMSRPHFSLNFPAQLVETQQEWDDLVLNPQTRQQVRELETWLEHGDTLLDGWGMRKKIKPGFRALFHGPPGTGKTLTASLLGKYTERDVYKIDLSMVVSKFIGETEKNLANLFAKAENKDWILFFDEADALFGKRTEVRDAHDKYANQEVSYLLQRVEGYAGLVILASNFKKNIDEAFLRRFQAIVHFPMPGPEERLILWEKAFPKKVKLEKDIQLERLASQFELTGADIMNVVQYCCLRALEKGANTISLRDIQMGIRREFSKSGKLLT